MKRKPVLWHRIFPQTLHYPVSSSPKQKILLHYQHCYTNIFMHVAFKVTKGPLFWVGENITKDVDTAFMIFFLKVCMSEKGHGYSIHNTL